MLFDAHTHVHFPKYDSDREEVIERAKKAGVKMLTVGTNLETSKQALETARRYPDQIWATAGFHPNHAVSFDWYHDRNESKSVKREQFNLAKLREVAKEEKVVAIGECGLDFYREEALSDEQRQEAHQEQERVFKAQIELALELSKPLMMHVRPSANSEDAYSRVFEILGEEKYLKLKKILHFYVGGEEMTKKFVEEGYFFTLGGVITFTDDYNESIQLIPLERLMLETDAPYVAPKAQRGKRNESSFVVEIAQKLADIKSVSYDEIAEQTTNNAERIFRIKI